MKVAVVFGTRPEAIKMCPLIIELKKCEDIKTIVCLTGQHETMLDQVMQAFEIVPDYNLHIMKENQTLSLISSSIMVGLDEIYAIENPDLVLVHGDTSSAFIAALCAFYRHIPIGHVEAGLRTGNMQSPFPEEFNRQGVDLISNLYFTPTEMSKTQLLNEGKPEDRIYVTGNTVIDALKTTVNNSYTNDILDWIGSDRMILLTAHRRENWGKPLENIFNAVNEIIEKTSDVKVIYPVHLNPYIKKMAHHYFEENERVKVIDPLDVIDFHNFMKKSYLILTDSGGVQEEAPALGVPVLVLRDTTERPEGIKSGTLKLVGTERKMIVNETMNLLSDFELYKKMSEANNPYGDGHASERIVSSIIKYFKVEGKGNA